MWASVPRLKKALLASCVLAVALGAWSYLLHPYFTPTLSPFSRFPFSSSSSSSATHIPFPAPQLSFPFCFSSSSPSSSELNDTPKRLKLSSPNNLSNESRISPTLEEIFGYQGNIITEELPPAKGAGGRFLIFECGSSYGLCGGWGDRQEGLVSVFLLAYLTKRRFGLRMDSPCDVKKFLRPNAYDWVVSGDEVRGKSTQKIPAIDKSRFSKDIRTMDFNSRYPQDVVIIHTNRDLLEHISNNSYYKDVLPSWARQRRPEFFRDVWRTLMRPSQDTEKRVQEFFCSLWLSDRPTTTAFEGDNPPHPPQRLSPPLPSFPNRGRNFLIGVHVRTGKSEHFSDGSFGDRLTNIGALWDFVQRYINNSTKGSDVTVFVATDNPEVIRQSKVKFGAHHRDTQAVLRHIDRQRSDPNICQALGGAILDQLILSRCDVLVVSPGSGFSARAAMMRGTNELLFNNNFRGKSISPADRNKMCDPIC